MPEVRKRIYKELDANSSDSIVYTVPSGKDFFIKKYSLDSGSSPDTIVSIVWDDGGAAEDILFATHGSVDRTNEDPDTTKTGDGTKQICIKIVNNQNQVDTLGGWFIADEED